MVGHHGYGERTPAFTRDIMQLGHQRGLEQSASDERGARGYALIQRAVDYLGAPRAEAVAGAALAAHLRISPAELERVIALWSGLSTAAFARALTIEHIRNRLEQSLPRPLGDGRAHAFDTRIVATITDEVRRRGAGLDVAYGFHDSPFGEALVLTAEGGICGLAFVDDQEGLDRRAALDDMAARWLRARFREAPSETHVLAAQIFAPSSERADRVVPLVLIGTPFDLEVWQALLQIPMGQIVSYTQLAQHLGRPSASRAVGSANGRNPISFVVPCHRALRGDGSLGGYYWGLTRKRAMIAWEAGRALVD
jgi:AraC family transcriptional regulator of adaptative response/methylated-DNA-[protein]-cysteine methyltransferase